METRTYEEAVDITVKWWSEKAFDTWPNQNNGDNSPEGKTWNIVRNKQSQMAQAKVTSDNRLRFEEKLRQRLLNKKGERAESNMLDVDYGPNSILEEACNFARIDQACLPCKTTTYISGNNIVHGKYQYGTPWFEL